MQRTTEKKQNVQKRRSTSDKNEEKEVGFSPDQKEIRYVGQRVWREELVKEPENLS